MTVRAICRVRKSFENWYKEVIASSGEEALTARYPPVGG